MTSLEALAAAGRLMERVPLAASTTYRLGGPARWFMEAESETDLMDLAAALAGEPVPLLVLGRGSNVLISDRGFPGVVVRLGAGFGSIEFDAGGTVKAGGSVPQPLLSRTAAARGMGGLEFMVGIPGSVGGAVRMNAGCRGTDTSVWLTAARVADLSTGVVRERSAASLELRYRHSCVAGHEVVVAATFRTIPRSRADCEAAMREITRWRKETQPGGTFNAGSVFKNPEGDHAGRIIDSLGLKGLTVGGVSVSDRHANFLVASPGASAQDVYDLIGEIRRRVAEETGVDLEPELRLVGDFGGEG